MPVPRVFGASTTPVAAIRKVTARKRTAVIE
jgi:hypothetical protein